MKDTQWDKFYKLPPQSIPWNNVQMDWFKELIDSGEIKGESALDVGCGVGIKSIYLANNGFSRVLGIDIAKRAIELANENAKKNRAEHKTEFLVKDSTDLNFLKNEKFDFILDWAHLHGLDFGHRVKYADQLSKHIHSQTIFLLRVFNSSEKMEYFISDMGGKVFFINEAEIRKLFSKYFIVVRKNQSAPERLKNFFFDEYLMKAKKSSQIH